MYNDRRVVSFKRVMQAYTERRNRNKVGNDARKGIGEVEQKQSNGD